MFFLQSFAIMYFKEKRVFWREQLQSQLTQNQWILHNRKNSFYGHIQEGQDCHTASTNVFFFFLVFPYSAAIFKPCVLWGHAKVEANDLQLLPPATFILYSHLFKNTGEQKEITERQATCWGGDWKRAWDQCRHCWRWGRAAPAPAAPGNTCRGAGAAQSQGPHGPGSAAASHCLLPS